MPILAQEIRRLRPKNAPFRKTDSKGLYLEVFPNGSKLWRYKFRIAGREKRMALGAWPDISLADARKRRDVARLKVLDGIDPTLERKRSKRQARMNAGNSFKSVAEDFIKVRMEDSGKAESTIRKARWYVSLLEPDIGRRPINDIEPVEVLECLKKIERRGHRESANRTRALASRVFRHGIACSLCKSDPAAHLGDALATPIVTHRAAILDPDKFGQLLRDIDEFTGTPLVRIAMQILPHIMTRPGEMRMGQWSEIDWGQRIWNIPAERTKLRRLQPAVPVLAGSFSGKSSGACQDVKKVNAEYERDNRRSPVIYVKLDTDGTVGSLATDILTGIGVMRPNALAADKRWSRARQEIRENGVSLLILDEFQRAGRRPTISPVIAGKILDIVDDGDCACAFVGKTSAEQVFASCPDLKNRLDAPVRMPPLRWCRDHDEFVLFADRLDQALVDANITRVKSGLGQKKLAQLLLEASNGLISQFSRIIETAVIAITREGHEVITYQDLSDAVEDWSVANGRISYNPLADHGASM